jgi:hypothetical protein
VVTIPSQRLPRPFCCWLSNNGIALSRNRACAAIDQFAIFKCELLHVSQSLDDEMDHLRAVFFVCAWGRLPSRRHRTMERLLQTVVDEVLPVLLEDLAWNRMCQIVPTVRLLLSFYLAVSAYLNRSVG